MAGPKAFRALFYGCHIVATYAEPGDRHVENAVVAPVGDLEVLGTAIGPRLRPGTSHPA